MFQTLPHDTRGGLKCAFFLFDSATETPLPGSMFTAVLPAGSPCRLTHTLTQVPKYRTSTRISLDLDTKRNKMKTKT